MAKSKALIAGLKNHAEWCAQHHISQEELSALEQLIAEGEQLNASVDALREQVHKITQEANSKLAHVKQQTQAMKREVKQTVDMAQWPAFGVPDKR